MKARSAMTALACVATLACGPSRDTSFVHALAAGDRAKTSGRHGEAATLYEQAATVPKEPRERDYATFLAASSYAQSGNRQDAARLYDALQAGRGEYATRARFERALLDLAVDEEQGLSALLAFAIAHPESALARRALLLVAERRAGSEGPERLSFFEAHLKHFVKTDMEERVRYEMANARELADDLRGAKAEFIALAHDFPYPQGALRDDALFRAAELELREGNARAAIGLLEELLADRETTSLVGSYERRRYVPAALRIAEIYRDRLKDVPRARAAYLRVVDDFHHTTSRDDALFEVALLDLSARGAEVACETMRKLAKTMPTSRYARCSAVICNEAAKAPGACPDYIERRIRAASAR